jgi:hypothetical protein
MYVVLQDYTPQQRSSKQFALPRSPAKNYKHRHFE